MRLLRRSGKQIKGGEMGTEIGGGSRKIRINVYLAELVRIIKWICKIIKGRRNIIEMQIFLWGYLSQECLTILW